jgi:Alpha/beta hydrolase family
MKNGTDAEDVDGWDNVPLPGYVREWKRIARQPFGTALLDRLSLLHPVTWWRVALFKRVEWKPVLYSAVAVAIPLCGCIYLTRESKSAGNRTHRRMTLWMYLSSPWTLAWTWRAASTVQQLFQVTRDMLASQSTTDPIAWHCLASRVAQGRAHRARGYDIYLPPPLSSDSSEPRLSHRFVLLFTGVSVEHVAYAQVAGMLSDDTTSRRRYTVVVVSAEPLRLVDCGLPRFQPAALRRLQRAIEQQYGDCNSDRGPQPEWILLGHSMGSLACTKLATVLDNVKALVLWGSSPFVVFMGDLSCETDIPVLVVQASKDLVIDSFATPEMTRRYWSLLPKTTVRHEIQDGTHSGFANYTSSWKPEYVGIDPKEQQLEAVRTTVTFLSDAI